jgi:hypothetical protein
MLKHVDVWSGKYRTISYEIKRFELGYGVETKKSLNLYDGADIYWNAYIYIREDLVPDDKKEDLVLEAKKNDRGRYSYDYYKSNIISELKLHGGCTFYEVAKHPGITLVKIGCDYHHLYDEGHEAEYNVEYVEFDIKKTINHLWNLVPNMKCWCQGNGGIYEISEGTVNSDGSFYSNEYMEKCKQDKIDAENKAKELAKEDINVAQNN